jgi:hypothetical protein
MNNGTDLSFLKGFAPQQGNWTGNTVNISGLPSAHIGTDPLPVPFWGNVKPAPRTPAQLNGIGGGGGGSVSPGMGGGDIFDILSQLHPQAGKPAPTQNTVQMPTIGGYTLTADDLAALQTLPDMLWPQTPQPHVTPTVTAQEGDQIPNNAPVYDGQPVSFHPMQGASPAVSTMEGDQIPNNAPTYDSISYGGSPYQVQAPNISWGGLTQADITRLMQTPTLPSDSSGGGFGSGLLDRVSSIGNSPHISGANVGQAAINAGGLFSPFIPIGAGILQGFNQYDPGETTGNPLADVAGTPGMLQSGTAKVANWFDRMFGGTPMPSSYVDPTVMGPTQDGSPYSAPPTPAQNIASDGGLGDATWGGMNTTYQDTRDTAFPNFMAGAGWGGAGFGYGGMGSPYGYGLPDNNGGWGQ